MDENTNSTARSPAKPVFPMWGPTCLLSCFFGGMAIGVGGQVAVWVRHGVPDMFTAVFGLLYSVFICSMAGFVVGLFIWTPRVATSLPLGPACLLFGFLGGTAFGIGETIVTWSRYGMSEKIGWPIELIVSVMICSVSGTLTGFVTWAILAGFRLRQEPAAGGR